MPWIFTVTSRKGAIVDPLFKRSYCSISVWDEADLHRRIRLAKDDPRDLIIEVQAFTPKGA